MKKVRYSFFDVTVWALVVWLFLYIPQIEMRVEEFDQPAREPAQAQLGLQSTTAKPEPIEQYLKLEKCFHMPREQCPKNGCATVGNMAVFCCDLDNQKMKEVLTPILDKDENATLANTTVKYLHVSNATIKTLDVTAAMFKRLTSMAFTDGNIANITGQFPKNSAMACLNISNNNLTSEKLPPAAQRPFAYLFNLTVLDASANNLTEFPLTLVHSNRNISLDLSGDKYIPCKQFQMAMEMESNNISKVHFLHYMDTYCVFDLRVGVWISEVQFVPIDHLRVQKELNASCHNIKPDNINCTCEPMRRVQVANQNQDPEPEFTNLVSVDCSNRRLKEMPTNLPPNTIKLVVTNNNITSLEAVSSDPSYEQVQQLFLDYNDISSIVELEGTKFIDTFIIFSIPYNKLKTIHSYVLSNRFDSSWPKLILAGNSIHCDCNTEKMLKPWLFEFSKNIIDYKLLMCDDNMGAVVDLIESQVCHTPRDWTDYIYYIIGLEVLILVLLVSKVSYDYWVFKTAGYLPWPANKMPRLPCDWLCE